MIEKVDSKTLKNMFISGARLLESNKQYVDELNVFPVPDGDTGTNMTLTILAAVKELNAADEQDMKAVAKAISSGSLRGARGNSGVILSQLFRGFAKEINESDFVDSAIFANACAKGVETAYKAVMKPKEGTILTVAKAVAERAAELAVDSEDLLFVVKEAINYGNEMLEKTPDMLPVLKQAGVVDSGGQGLMYVLEGGLHFLETGEMVEENISQEESSGSVGADVQFIEDSGDIKFGYCTEFIVNVKDQYDSYQEAAKLREYLSGIGDSIVAVADDDIIKIHVHTNNPGNALQKGLELGELVNMKIDNMREEHRNRVVSNEEHNQAIHDTNSEIVPEEEVPLGEKKENGFIAVSIGSGLTEIFKSLGVDHVVEGGQTMNPSTEDMLNAIDKVHAENVFILPNNKNIILAAEQAKALVKDKTVYVIPAKSIPQGISAMISYENGSNPVDNFKVMSDAVEDVVTGQVTYAIRDTSIDDREIKEGDLLGIGDGKILTVKKNTLECAQSLIDEIVNEDSELVSLYYGEDAKKEEVEAIRDYIEEHYEDCDIDVHYGGQPLYYYIISVE